jgi:hypothetical protein
MAGTASQIQAAVSAALATVPGLRVADHLPEQVAPPMAVIQMETVTYHRTMQGGTSEWAFLISLIAGRMGERSAQRQLDGWLSYDGSQSIRAALEVDPTLNGIVQSLIVAEMASIRLLTMGDATFLTCDFNLTVHA